MTESSLRWRPYGVFGGVTSRAPRSSSGWDARTLVPMSAENDISDGAVVRAVLGGSKDAYRILVRRYQDALYRHALRMVKHPDEAADIVQRAFVNGFRKLERCHDPDRVGGWLFRIAANLCKDFLKSPRREDVSVEGAEIPLVGGEDVERDLERSETRRIVQAALSRLSAEQREAFVMKHVDGRSYEEMCGLLGVSKSALKMRVMRAREELQSLLGVYR